MSRDDLVRLLRAADDDAILAAWVKVLTDYNVESHFDVPPHEHWEAFQELFSCELLSTLQFESVDMKQEFFAGRRPRQADVQNVLDNARAWNKPCSTEIQMSKQNTQIETLVRKKTARNFSVDTEVKMMSLQRKKVPNMLSMDTEAKRLSFQNKKTRSLTAFKSNQKELAPVKEDRMVKARRDLVSLECNRGVDAGVYVGGMDINGHISCCGKQLKTMEEGGDIITQEDLPSSGEYALLEYMFHAECTNCKSVYHVTCGKPVPRDNY